MGELINLFTEAPGFISNIITANKKILITLIILLAIIFLLRWFQKVNKKLKDIK